MNDTRRDWTNFDCNKVKEKNYNVLSLSGIFGFLTFIYYAAVRKHEKYKSKIQTRTYRLLLLIETRLGCMAYKLIANGRENVYFYENTLKDIGRKNFSSFVFICKRLKKNY